MSQLLLLNPRKRGAKRRKAPSAKQLAARRRFAAMARGRAKTKRASGSKRRRRSTSIVVMPVAAHARRRRRAVALRRNPVRRLRRNPISGASMKASVRSLLASAQQAAIGGAGAVATDIAMGYAKPYLPASMQSQLSATGGVNFAYYAAKFALAAALGIVPGMVVKSAKVKRLAAQAAEGAMTVQAYEIAKAIIPTDMFTMGAYQRVALTNGTGPAGTGNTMRTMSQLGAYSAVPRARRLNGIGAYASVPRIMTGSNASAIRT